MADLTSLIERIEAATFETQHAVIYDALVLFHRQSWITDNWYDAAMEMRSAGAFLDAVMTLMPEGWSILSAWNGRDAICTVHLKPLGDPTGIWPPASKAKSQALALLAAILRAKQTEARG